MSGVLALQRWCVFIYFFFYVRTKNSTETSGIRTLQSHIVSGSKLHLASILERPLIKSAWKYNRKTNEKNGKKKKTHDFVETDYYRCFFVIFNYTNRRRNLK